MEISGHLYGILKNINKLINNKLLIVLHRVHIIFLSIDIFTFFMFLGYFILISLVKSIKRIKINFQYQEEDLSFLHTFYIHNNLNIIL